MRKFIVLLALTLPILCTQFGNFIENNQVSLIPLTINEANCDAICLLSIIPGETEYAQAIDIIESSELILSDEDNYWFINNDGSRVDINIVRTSPLGGQYVSYIELIATSGRILSLNELLDSGLTLSTLYRSNISGPNTIGLLLVFGGNTPIMAVVSANGEIDQNSPIIHLLLIAPQDFTWHLDDIRHIRGFEDEIQWIGYASVDDYWRIELDG